MIDYVSLKAEVFYLFRNVLERDYRGILNSFDTQNIKAQLLNKAVERALHEVQQAMLVKYRHVSKQKLYMLIQYCFTVVSLEYRHSVWPYEYMAFSRRNGELWERFCKTAWDYSEKDTLYRINPPSFNNIRDSFYQNLKQYQLTNEQLALINRDLDGIFDLVGDINMVEDEMFNLNDRNHIIDFKSGFGSNEKGNTLRLLAVGRAYKIWDSNVELLFLVRQNENNNYLELIKRSNIWNVFCGIDAYSKIDQLTDSGILEIRHHAIDFQSDFSEDFWSYLLENHLVRYLNW